MLKYVLFLPLIFPVLSSSAHATYSIVACDAQSRQCGVAVQTNNLAVGASVPYAEAGVGAIASQFETNPTYGPRGLALLAQGKSPDETLKQLLREDGNFDGQGIEARQVGIVALNGVATSYTGQEAASSDWAGARSGPGYSIQGNGLAGPQVVEAMEHAFLKTAGPLAERLLAALIAGDTAGGQKTGRQSSALLVRTPEGFPLDIDLRVDDASDPVAALKKLYEMQAARQQIVEASIAARRGNFDQAKALLIAGVARGPSWLRVWIRAAKTAEDIEEPELALQYITVAFSQNPVWAEQEIGSGDYAELGANPQFHRWVTPVQEQLALSAYHDLVAARQSTLETRMEVSRVLLEAGHSQEALALLNDPADGKTGSVSLQLLRAEAYAANGDYVNAIKQCQSALTMAPRDLRVRLKMAHLRMREDVLLKAQ